MTMYYRIFQLKDIRNTIYGFVGWCEAVERDFNINDYKEVYSGEMEQKYILENLYEKFNINHPADFRGHSMSVSDVVALRKPENDYWYWYYCDSFGWKEITEVITK